MPIKSVPSISTSKDVAGRPVHSKGGLLLAPTQKATCCHFFLSTNHYHTDIPLCTYDCWFTKQRVWVCLLNAFPEFYFGLFCDASLIKPNALLMLNTQYTSHNQLMYLSCLAPQLIITSFFLVTLLCAYSKERPSRQTIAHSV